MKAQFICLAAGLALTPMALADELHVPSQYPTIAAAIAASKAGDEVVLADGVYTDQYVGMPSHVLTLRSASGDPALCIVQASGEAGSRVIGPTSASTIRGITFRGGSGEYQGGAMSTGSSPRFERCIFTGNHTSGSWDGTYTTGMGGAIYLSGSSAIFDQCIFSSNSARITPVLGMGNGYGGAMYIDGGSPVFLNCEFRSNSARGNDFGGGIGGALYITNGAEVQIQGGVFAGNSTYWDGGGGAGGAIRIGGSSLVATGATFDGNSASAGFGGNGGALITGSGATVEMLDCSVIRNRASGTYVGSESYGGGFAIYGGSVSITSSLVADNIASDAVSYGGAIDLYGTASLTVRSSTIVGNDAAVGGAVFVDAGEPTLGIANSIVYGNGAEALSGVDPSTAITWSDIEGGWPGAGNIDADPMLVDPAAGDWRPGPGSPVIDAGDNTAVPTGIITDLAGLPRFVDDPATPDTGVPGGPGGSAIVDMGAYEYQGDFCYADCDGSGELDFADFLCFQNAFASGDAYADCDGSGAHDFFDFLCFQNAFAAGCSR